MSTPGQITDQIVDLMARNIWEADLESHNQTVVVMLPTAWERSKPMYRRRARASLEVLIEHGVLAGELP